MPRPRRFASSGGLLLAAFGLLHCGGSPAVRAARDGRTAEAWKEAHAELYRGKLDHHEAVALAHAVARSEVLRAEGDPGVTRIRELATCARSLDHALAKRSSKHDRPGAEAAMARLDAGLVEPGALAPWYARAGAPVEWRAVGARALLLPEDAGARRGAMADGDEDVRFAALRAAADAADPGDADAVLEAARLDPRPLNRTQAVRAAGAIGGERVVLALKDLWATADAPLRQAIVGAWATGRSVDAGGRRELALVADAQASSAAIAAADALARLGGEGADQAVGVLARAIASASTSDRVFAIGVARQSVDVLREAVVKAEEDPDEVVALAALTRRLESTPAPRGRPVESPERTRLIAKLLPIAAAEETPRALLATAALARAGARELLPLLAKDGQVADLRRREASGAGYVALGELGRAAAGATDPDPHVRTAIACAVLRAAHER